MHVLNIFLKFLFYNFPYLKKLQLFVKVITWCRQSLLKKKVKNIRCSSMYSIFPPPQLLKWGHKSAGRGGGHMTFTHQAEDSSQQRGGRGEGGGRDLCEENSSRNPAVENLHQRTLPTHSACTIAHLYTTHV